MATASKSPPELAQDTVPTRADGFLLEGVSWDTYESLLKDFERTGSNVRMTYNRGSLELMSPAKRHERRKSKLSYMILRMVDELNIDVINAGMTTFKDRLKELGVEPDECFWISHEAVVRDRDEEDFDPEIDPPPDLAIEVENTRTILDRLPILAALGFPEVWRVTSDRILVGLLQADGTYAWGNRSEEFPFLDMADLERWLVQSRGQRLNVWIRDFCAWVRAELAPQHRRPDPDPAG